MMSEHSEEDFEWLVEECGAYVATLATKQMEIDALKEELRVLRQEGMGRALSVIVRVLRDMGYG